MRLALAQALKAQADGEIPVGAVVVKDGEVIGVGHNAPIASNDPSAHAEIVALRAAAQALGNYRLDGCELFVTLEPCAMCAGAMLHARIDRVVFGANEPKTGAAGSVVDLFANTNINYHTAVTSGVLAEECSEIIRSFFQERRLEKALQVQPLSEDALRTPASAFGTLKDYPFLSRFINTGFTQPGWRMHFLDEGPSNSMVTVLCLHNVCSWSYQFRNLISVLATKGVRVIAPDMIGFGMSDKPKKESAHTVELHLESHTRLLKHLYLSSFVVVGEGSGILLAKLIARDMPNSVLQLYELRKDSGLIPTDAVQMPFPGKGYQAGLRASTKLLEKLKVDANACPDFDFYECRPMVTSSVTTVLDLFAASVHQ
jgi:tRNA(adenine34) deaminase